MAKLPILSIELWIEIRILFQLENHVLGIFEGLWIPSQYSIENVRGK